MSITLLMIGGWATWFAMIGFCALCESGKLLRVRQRIAVWLETSSRFVRGPEGSQQAEHGRAF
jgi:hypothetical protein